MMLLAGLAHPRSLVACAALLAAGCTMCPDPHDYAGPVPNGSAPQNDFRARSNGILAIGSSPQPFPMVVKSQRQPAADPPVPEPVAEERRPELAEAEDDVLRLSAEEPADPEAGDAPVPDAVPLLAAGAAPRPEAAEPSGGDAGGQAVAAAVTAGASVAQPATMSSEPSAEPAPRPVAAPDRLRETPGWRPRR